MFFLLVAHTLIVYAAEGVTIQGLNIPRIDGSAKAEVKKGHGTTIYMYETARPLAEVVDFYRSFFKSEQCVLIGGVQADGSFDAAIKKDTVQFYLKITAAGDKTQARFIW